MTTMNDNAQKALRDLVSRIENLEQQKAAITGDIRDIYQESKAGGYDIKALRQLISRRKKQRQEVKTLDEILDLYEGVVNV